MRYRVQCTASYAYPLSPVKMQYAPSGLPDDLLTLTAVAVIRPGCIFPRTFLLSTWKVMQVQTYPSRTGLSIFSIRFYNVHDCTP
jgi:hypothetical protein